MTSDRYGVPLSSLAHWGERPASVDIHRQVLDEARELLAQPVANLRKINSLLEFVELLEVKQPLWIM